MYYGTDKWWQKESVCISIHQGGWNKDTNALSFHTEHIKRGRDTEKEMIL